MLKNYINRPFFLLVWKGMHYLHMEAPVKVIHRDLKSRNGNVVISFYFTHFIIKYMHLCIEISIILIFCSQLFWLTADIMKIFPLLINVKILYIISRGCIVFHCINSTERGHLGCLHFFSLIKNVELNTF